LLNYDYTNVTVHQADKEQSILYMPSPFGGIYSIGVCLYGSAQWAFDLPHLVSGKPFVSLWDGSRLAKSCGLMVFQYETGVRATDVVNGTKINYYQVSVPVNTKLLKFQMSRKVPGGYPVCFPFLTLFFSVTH
jgi:hypothetical protein